MKLKKECQVNGQNLIRYKDALALVRVNQNVTIDNDGVIVTPKLDFWIVNLTNKKKRNASGSPNGLKLDSEAAISYISEATWRSSGVSIDSNIRRKAEKIIGN